MALLLAPLILALVVVIFAVILFNSLVVKRNAADNAFACIDAQLKRRYDLIPNLVESVKAYMGHEANTLTEIARLRANAVSPEQKADVEAKIGGALRGLMVAVESYPQLKASDNFQQLQRTLNEIEEQLVASRRAYNASATEFNNAIQTFPYLLFAAMFNFTRRSLIEASVEERSNPDVGKLFKG